MWVSSARILAAVTAQTIKTGNYTALRQNFGYVAKGAKAGQRLGLKKCIDVRIGWSRKAHLYSGLVTDACFDISDCSCSGDPVDL